MLAKQITSVWAYETHVGARHYGARLSAALTANPSLAFEVDAPIRSSCSLGQCKCNACSEGRNPVDNGILKTLAMECVGADVMFARPRHDHWTSKKTMPLQLVTSIYQQLAQWKKCGFSSEGGGGK